MLPIMIAPASNALDRMLKPLAQCFTPESAERLLQFRIDPDTSAKIEELAGKANDGRLTDAERAEYLDYVDAMDLIAILQGEARQVLVRRSPP